jgi:hypothetical protein
LTIFQCNKKKSQCACHKLSRKLSWALTWNWMHTGNLMYSTYSYVTSYAW